MASKMGHFFLSPALKPGGLMVQPCTFFPSAPSNQKSSPESRLLPCRPLSASLVSLSTTSLPVSLRPRKTKISLGDVSEERVKTRRPSESGWMAETAPLEVSSRGLRNSSENEGSAVEVLGVGGTGREKILIRARSPAVKKTVLSS